MVAGDIDLFFAARSLAGLGIGLSSALTPIFLAEIAIISLVEVASEGTRFGSGLPGLAVLDFAWPSFA